MLAKLVDTRSYQITSAIVLRDPHFSEILVRLNRACEVRFVIDGSVCVACVGVWE